jgi:hypothetical protein
MPACLKPNHPVDLRRERVSLWSHSAHHLFRFNDRDRCPDHNDGHGQSAS